jgi:hypothetical protein
LAEEIMMIHKRLVAGFGAALLLFCAGLRAAKLDVLATNDLGEGQKNEWTQSVPSAAVSEGRIFLRGPKSLTCIGKK